MPDKPSPRERPCAAKTLHVHGYHGDSESLGDLAVYGSDAAGIRHVVWATRFEMARTVDDVLSRRTRALLLNARAAISVAPAVARLMAAELGRDAAWQAGQVAAFRAIAEHYLIPPRVAAAGRRAGGGPVVQVA